MNSKPVACTINPYALRLAGHCDVTHADTLHRKTLYDQVRSFEIFSQLEWVHALPVGSRTSDGEHLTKTFCTCAASFLMVN